MNHNVLFFKILKKIYLLKQTRITYGSLMFIISICTLTYEYISFDIYPFDNRVQLKHFLNVNFPVLPFKQLRARPNEQYTLFALNCTFEERISVRSINARFFIHHKNVRL